MAGTRGKSGWTKGNEEPVQTPELQAHGGRAAGDKSTKLNPFIITQFLKKLWGGQSGCFMY